MPSIITSITGYLPAVAKEIASSGFVVEYYFYDKINDKMKRKRIKLNVLSKRYKTKREKLFAAQQMANSINEKLKNGWLPAHETDNGRLYTPIAELREKFISAKRAEGLRETTLRQYSSVTDIFVRWCEDKGCADKRSGTFLRNDAVVYMDSILEQGNRRRSYNNTVKALRVFFQWSLDHLYCKENPFAFIKTLKNEEKIRILIDERSRAKISEYYAKKSPMMNLVCNLVYSSAIRPIEILRIKLGDIDVGKHYIRIPAENAKNHKERFATITPAIVEMLLPIAMKYSDVNLFLIGKNQELMPDVEPLNESHFQKSWDRMRRATGLPKEMQLYSLRDTGLTDLLHAGIDQLTVRHHADHSSVAMQDVYTNHYDKDLNETIYNKAPKF